MISGAAGCDASVGSYRRPPSVREQSHRHGYLLHLLGVRDIAVAVTKMDLVDFSAERFEQIETDFRSVLEALGMDVSAVIPVSGAMEKISSHILVEQIGIMVQHY